MEVKRALEQLSFCGVTGAQCVGRRLPTNKSRSADHPPFPGGPVNADDSKPDKPSLIQKQPSQRYCHLTHFDGLSAALYEAYLSETKGLNLEDMDEPFRDSPTFVPGSKWVPSSQIEEDAKRLVSGDKGLVVEHVDQV